MKQRGLIILAAALVLVGAIGLVSMWMFGRGFTQPGSSSVEPTSMDRMFIEQMVPHHQDAIDMAELALERAEHREIRELAESIRGSQSAENDQMRSWYREWFGTSVPDLGDQGGMMGGPMMGGGSDLERLRNASDFDKEFIEQMVPHHRMGIMMARMAQSSTATDEIRRLAGSIIDAQSREIREMQGWYQEWYDG